MDTQVREMAFSLSHGYCRCTEECCEKANEIHHKLANTKVNRKKYPLFVESIFNLCPINHDCHMTKTLPRVSDHEAAIYERYLYGKTKKTRAKRR